MTQPLAVGSDGAGPLASGGAGALGSDGAGPLLVLTPRCRAPADGPLGEAHWVRVLPEEEGVAIEDMDVFQVGGDAWYRAWGLGGQWVRALLSGAGGPTSIRDWQHSNADV